MQKVTQSQINKIIICVLVNVILLIVLYLLPINNNSFSLCLHKLITGQECWNCGMTRAFLSILHFDFQSAWEFNKNCIVVFPLIVGIYINWWYKIIFKEKNNKKS